MCVVFAQSRCAVAALLAGSVTSACRIDFITSTPVMDRNYGLDSDVLFPVQ